MLQRSVAQRLVAWMMVVLLALIVGEPLRTHVCPMHDGSVLTMLASAAGDAGAARGVHGTAHGNATHDGASHDAHGVGDDGHAPSAPASPAAQHNCQCLGTCCSTAPVTTPDVAVALSVTATLVATVIAAPAVPIAVPGASDVVLPFAIGPPRVV